MRSELRYVAKHDSNGWGVYDTQNGCWPSRVYGVAVRQGTTEDIAHQEAAKLNSLRARTEGP